MQTLVSGLHNCLEFSQSLSCLYKAMQTPKRFQLLKYILYLKYIFYIFIKDVLGENK